MTSTSCADDEPPVAEIVIAVQTDVALPDSVDAIRVEVTRLGKLEFGQDYKVGKGDLLIPATLGLLRGQDAGTPVTIRLIAKKLGASKMLREVTTTIPTRIALLRLPIRWLCDDSAKDTPAGTIDAKCGAGQTCIGGECVSAAVDSSTLPDFSGDKYGGDGTCFDVVGCMKDGVVATPDAACTIPKPAGATAEQLQQLNVALGVANDGVCDDTRQTCFVILDKGVGGWADAVSDRVQLPKAVCTRIADTRVTRVVTSVKCGTKTEAAPICGSWSSVGPAAGAPGTTNPDGGPPITPAGTVGGFYAGVTFAPGLTCPIQITAQNQLVFCASIPTGEIQVWRQALDGSPASQAPIVKYAPVNASARPLIGVDAVFWLEQDSATQNNVLKKQLLDGSAPTLVKPIGFKPISASFLDGDTIYASSQNDATRHALYAIPTDLPGERSVASNLSRLDEVPTAVIADGLPTASGFVYVSARNTMLPEPSPGIIEKFPKQAVDAGAASQVITTAGGPLFVKLDGDMIYFVTAQSTPADGGQLLFTGSIYRASTTTPAATPELIVTVPGGISPLAIDATDIYFAANEVAPETSTLYRIPKAGGQPAVTVATGKPHPTRTGSGFLETIYSVAVSDTTIYYTASRAGTDATVGGYVYALPKK